MKLEGGENLRTFLKSVKRNNLKIARGPTEAGNFSVQRSTRIAGSSNEASAPIVSCTNNMETINTPRNAASSWEEPEPEFSLFHGT